jgi:outer membrane protein assembly factor BamB
MKKHLGIIVMFGVLLIAAISLGAIGTVRKVPPEGAWKDTLAAISLNGKIYTIELSGAFVSTDPKSGARKILSKLDFVKNKNSISSYSDATRIFTLNNKIYVITWDTQTLYAINPLDGKYETVSSEGWDTIEKIAGVDGKLFVIDERGDLKQRDLVTGEESSPFGGLSEYMHAWALLPINGKIYIIQSTGSLVKVNLADGSAVRLGENGEWGGYRGVIVLGSRLFFASSAGVPEIQLLETNIEDGSYKSLCKLDVPNDGLNMRHWFGIGDAIYAMDTVGDLYEISVK